MRQHQEALFPHGLDHILRHLLGREHALLQEALALATFAHQHRRAHALRAQAADANALVAVLDSKPLGHRHSGVLGHRVDGRFRMRQQPGGRSGLQQIAFAAFQHLRHDRTRAVHMGHQVDFPQPLPVGVARLQAAAGDDAGVGTQHVDASIVRRRLRDQRLHLRFVRDVGAHGQAAHFGGHGLRLCFVEVGHHDSGRALLREAPHQRRADSRGPAGDDDDLALHLHVRLLLRERWSAPAPTPVPRAAGCGCPPGWPARWMRCPAARAS